MCLPSLSEHILDLSVQIFAYANLLSSQVFLHTILNAHKTGGNSLRFMANRGVGSVHTESKRHSTLMSTLPPKNYVHNQLICIAILWETILRVHVLLSQWYKNVTLPALEQNIAKEHKSNGKYTSSHTYLATVGHVL